jgi:hypothetical protein
MRDMRIDDTPTGPRKSCLRYAELGKDLSQELARVNAAVVEMPAQFVLVSSISAETRPIWGAICAAS